MDFALSEEQELLKKSARDFLNTECPKSRVKEIETSEMGYSPELWQKMADLGWLGLAFPEEYGGAGCSLLDLAVLFEEFGRAAVPGPMFSTLVMGALPILDCGTQEQKKLLAEVAKGETILTMAITEPRVIHDQRLIATRAVPKGDKFVISGTKLFVHYAHIADYMLVTARTEGSDSDDDGITVFIVDSKAPGIKLAPLTTIAADKQFEVIFDGVAVSSRDIVGELNMGLSLIKDVLTKATAIQCAMMVGGAQQELEMTAEYTKKRIQFERPIGSFQGVQLRLGDMYIDVRGSRWTTYQAIWRLSQGLPADREVAIAKVFTSNACQRVAYSAQQLHGGIGVDIDYELHYYFRRAKAYELTLGSAPVHLKTLEEEMSAGANVPWAHQ